MNEGLKMLLQIIIIPIISAFTALGGVWLAQRKQADQELVKDKRALRDQKRERLRGLYEKALLAGFAFEYNITRRTIVLEGETPEQRDRDIEKQVAQSTKNLEEVQVSLMLDADGKKILSHLQAVIQGCRNNGQILRSGDTRKVWQDVEGILNALREAALAHLEELQQPIGK